MKNNLYIDYHVIQTVPPSCVNRDDTGSPKTAIYGGVRRARVSSQSWKSAIRQTFREYFDERELGTRTKRIVDMLVEEILNREESKSQEEACKLAEEAFKLSGIQTESDKKSGEKMAKAMFFLSKKQVGNLADLILENPNATKKDFQTILNQGHGVDVALFGRMVADDPFLNTDASAQVAHAISTHKVENEYDYFTAVDDRAPKDNAGAGMIGTVEFNSSTLYRYATIAAHELLEQLGDEDALEKAVSEFTRAFVTSMPTGKQNTFANRTCPDAVMVTLRKNQPVNLIGAFENPVKAKNEGYVGGSINALEHYTDDLYRDFCGKPERAYIVGRISEEFGAKVTLPELIGQVGGDAVTLLKSGGEV